MISHLNITIGIICFLFSVNLFANINDFDRREQQKTIQDVISACQGYQQSHLQIKYQETNICNVILEIQQIGADLAEFIKLLMPLKPLEYFLVTVINYSTTGRLRAQLQPLIHPKVRNVIEYRREGEIIVFLSYEF